MDAKIKVFTGIDKSQKVVNEIIFCENDTNLPLLLFFSFR